MRTEHQIGPDAVEQRARVDWRRFAFLLSYWSENDAEKEVLLGGLMDFLLPQKYFVVPDTGWSQWDLKIARGLWSRALVTVCAENHGGSKRLLQVRCAMRMSSLASYLVWSYAALTAAGLILGSPVTAGIFCALGVINLGVIGWQLATFGRLMHRIIETVAGHAKLVPVDPIVRAPLPFGPPRTV